jgi:hypothetical protein
VQLDLEDSMDAKHGGRAVTFETWLPNAGPFPETLLTTAESLPPPPQTVRSPSRTEICALGESYKTPRSTAWMDLGYVTVVEMLRHEPARNSNMSATKCLN